MTRGCRSGILELGTLQVKELIYVGRELQWVHSVRDSEELVGTC